MPSELEPLVRTAAPNAATRTFSDARVALDRADALILRGSAELFSAASPAWTRLPLRLLREKPSVSQLEGEPLPQPLRVLVERVLEGPGTVAI